MSFQQLHLVGGGLVLFLEPLQIGLGHDRGGIRLAQRVRVFLILLRSGGHLRADALVLRARGGQLRLHLFLPRVGILELLVRRYKRAGILLHREVLLGEL